VDYTQYYIYAFDIKKKHITAALSCPDEKTAKRAYLIASRKMEMEYDTKGFSFGYACIDSRTDNISVDLLGTGAVSIEYMLPARGNQKSGRLTSTVCKIDDFIESEAATKRLLHNIHCRLRDIQFMCYVESAMSSSTIQEAEDDQEDVFDRLAKIEGRWVSQKDFSDGRINKAAYGVGTLHTYRIKGNVEMSKKEPSIGIDKGGNFFVITRKGDHPNAPHEYRYYLRRDCDLQQDLQFSQS